jgi:hypothetical protein
MPFYLQLFNMLCLALVEREGSVRKIRKNAVVDLAGSLPAEIAE